MFGYLGGIGQDVLFDLVDLAFELSRSKYSGPAGFELHVKDLRQVKGARAKDTVGARSVARPPAVGGGLTGSPPVQ